MKGNQCGNNQFKRAYRNSRVCALTDARNPKNLAVIYEPQNFRIVRDPIFGYTYMQILPNRRQKFSDKKQLKAFPGYRIIDFDNCRCGECGGCAKCGGCRGCGESGKYGEYEKYGEYGEYEEYGKYGEYGI